MEVTPLELGLAVAAIVVLFGPKRKPKARTTATVIRRPKVDTAHLRPAYYAAGRAPSPLASRTKTREFQFATAESEAAPLPHEFYWT